MTLIEVRPERVESPPPRENHLREPVSPWRGTGPPRGYDSAPPPNWAARRVAFAAAATVLMTASLSWTFGSRSESADEVSQLASPHAPASTPTAVGPATASPSVSPSASPSVSQTPSPEVTTQSPSPSPTPSESAAEPAPKASPSSAESAKPDSQPSTAAEPITTGPPEVGGKKVVYLTFDDGPDPRWTPAILDALAEHKVRATFFVVGSQIEAHPDLAKRIVAEGHSLQNHTWSHHDMTELGRSDAMEEVTRTSDAIKTAAGAAPTCLRPPEGATNSAVQEIAGASGQSQVLWSVDTKDWSNKSTDKISSIATGGLQPGAVILMHDGGGDRSATVAALPAVLRGMADAGLAGAPLCAG